MTTRSATPKPADRTLHSCQLVVLVGGSGRGKSTVARALQEQLLPEQWLHFSTDTLLYCLPQPILDAANTRNDWSAIDVPLIRQSALSCLQAILLTGNRVIFDCVVSSGRAARELVVTLQAHQPLLIALTCSWQEIERRTLARGDRTVEEAEHGFRASLQHLEVDRIIDTTDRDPLAVARDVLELLQDGPREAWRRNLERLDGSQEVP